ncbi:MAG: FAD:protein FMN transferase [Tannerella sp.]|jgi:thiamine biosynthesis lipoprotein|nr:FAD:protein FMN transferase [Tannerella sp.]
MYTNYYLSSRLFHGSIEKVMGTRLDALLFGDEPASLKALWLDIIAEMLRLEKMLNRFDAGSALSQVNMNAVLYPVGMNDELWAILMDCKRYHVLTEGCFDITLGHWNEVSFDEVNRTVFFTGRASFDLGGYAKGYAAQKISLLLKRDAVTRALVNFGNSMALALGTHPHGNFWPAGIDNPYTNQPVDNLRLRDTALSVSGNAPARPDHIICPATGERVTAHKMVAIVAPHPVDAEVLTTALMADDGSAENWLGRFDIHEYKMYNC